jgi:hypothetical protein
MLIDLRRQRSPILHSSPIAPLSALLLMMS